MDFIISLKKRGFQPVLLALKSGDLKNDFKAITSIFLLHQTLVTKNRSFFIKILGRFWNNKFAKNIYDFCIFSIFKAQHWKIIYANTVETGAQLTKFKFSHAIKVFHLHEGKRFLKLFNPQLLQEGCAQANLIIACSDYVRKSIYEIYAGKSIEVAKTPLRVNHAFLEEITIKPIYNLDIKQKLKFGSSGSIGWIKGSDLMIPLVKELKILGLDFEYYWIGGDKSTKEFVELEKQINDFFPNDIKLISSTQEPFQFFENLDAFVLLSRDEALSMVALENAALGNPVFGFKDSGGIEEILKFNTDLLSPYINVKALAFNIFSHFQNKNELQLKANSLREYVIKDFDQEKIHLQIFNLLEKTMLAND